MGLFTGFIMGKSNHPDYTPDMMPKNRLELFFEMLKLNLLNLLKLNLMYFVFWIPFWLWTWLHLQVLLNTIDFGMNPQEALDAPRFQWVGGKKVQLERAVPTDIALKLAAMGHEVEIMNDTYSMGRGEIIWRWDDEVLVGASEPRCDGHVASW